MWSCDTSRPGPPPHRSPARPKPQLPRDQESIFHPVPNGGPACGVALSTRCLGGLLRGAYDVQFYAGAKGYQGGARLAMESAPHMKSWPCSFVKFQLSTRMVRGTHHSLLQRGKLTGITCAGRPFWTSPLLPASRLEPPSPLGTDVVTLPRRLDSVPAASRMMAAAQGSNTSRTRPRWTIQHRHHHHHHHHRRPAGSRAETARAQNQAPHEKEVSIRYPRPTGQEGPTTAAGHTPTTHRAPCSPPLERGGAWMAKPFFSKEKIRGGDRPRPATASARPPPSHPRVPT